MWRISAPSCQPLLYKTLEKIACYWKVIKLGTVIKVSHIVPSEIDKRTFLSDCSLQQPMILCTNTKAYSNLWKIACKWSSVRWPSYPRNSLFIMFVARYFYFPFGVVVSVSWNNITNKHPLQGITTHTTGPAI